MELVLPMYNVHPYFFSSKIWAKNVHITHGKRRYFMPGTLLSMWCGLTHLTFPVTLWIIRHHYPCFGGKYKILRGQPYKVVVPKTA